MNIRSIVRVILLFVAMTSPVFAQTQEQAEQFFKEAEHEILFGSSERTKRAESRERNLKPIGKDENGNVILEYRLEPPSPLMLEILQRQSRIQHSPVGEWRWEGEDGEEMRLTVNEVASQGRKCFIGVLDGSDRWPNGTKSKVTRVFRAKLPFEFESKGAAVMRETYTLVVSDHVARGVSILVLPNGELIRTSSFRAERGFELGDLVGSWRLIGTELAGNSAENVRVKRKLSLKLLVRMETATRFSVKLLGDQLSNCRVTDVEANGRFFTFNAKGRLQGDYFESRVKFQPRGDVMYGEWKINGNHPMHLDGRRLKMDGTENFNTETTTEPRVNPRRLGN